MASVAEELDRCLSYALQWLGTPELQLKTEQRSAIESVYRGKDIFVWLPTGFGKSMCYQTLPFVFDSKLDRVNSQSGSVVLVVSTLIALMVDQVVSLRGRGVNAAVITTGLVHAQTIFLHAERKNNLVNCLFNFCSKRHVRGAPIRVLHANDVTHCTGWRSKMARQLKRYAGD